MALKTIVGIIAADTGDLLGSGSLVLAKAVLVHPPLSARLVREHRARRGTEVRRLRVCVTTWSGSAPRSELLDVAAIVVSEQAAPGTRRRVVGLELASASSAGLLPALAFDDDLARHLAAPMDATTLPDRAPENEDSPEDGVHPLCRLVGLFCPRRR